MFQFFISGSGSAPVADSIIVPAYQSITQQEEENFVWWQQQTRIALDTFLPQPPVLRQGDQTIYSSPDDWQECGVYRTQSLPTSIADVIYRHDQTVYPPLDDWQEWQAYKAQPLPVTFLPQPPTIHQHDQRIDPLPDYWQEWEAYTTRQPLPVTSLPQPPALRQRSQERAYPAQDSDWTNWWDAIRHQIKASTTPVVSGVPTHQPSQTWWELKNDCYVWWEQIHTTPLRSNISSAQEGTYSVYNLVGTPEQIGLYRVQNNILGYLVYVGTNQLPDLSLPATTFSLTLPISIPVTPPVSGTTTFYVLVRAQDHYGLQSQNSCYTAVTIDSSGNLVLPAIGVPQSLRLYEVAGGIIRVLAQYPGAVTDLYPADKWKVWIKSTLPDPTVDTPTAIINVSGMILSYTTTGLTYTPGTYYVMVGLYRTLNNTLSPTIYGTIVIHGIPDEVIAVPSGDDLP